MRFQKEFRRRNVIWRARRTDWKIITLAVSAIWIISTICFYLCLDEWSNPMITKPKVSRATMTIASDKDTEIEKIVIPKNQRLPNKDRCPVWPWPTKVPSITNKSLAKFCASIRGGCDKKYENGIRYNERYNDTTNERRKDLDSMLSPLMDDKENDAVILMSVNYGYSWLFANWVCSLEHNLNKAQIENIKKKTIVVVTDEKAQKAVNEMGFMTHYPDWLGDELLSEITEQGAMKFSGGSHTDINALTIAIMNDLINLNYTVLMQDADLVWRKDPIPWLMNNVHDDLSMMCDGRNDEAGPGNSGFVFVRSNCKTKMFMETLWSARWQLGAASDQNFWNALIKDDKFREVNFHILDLYLFGDGRKINLKHGGDGLPAEHMVFHASWTKNTADKIQKFVNTEHFYYQAQLCPYYDESMIPNAMINEKNKKL